MKGWDGNKTATIEGVKITRSKVEPATQWSEWPRLRIDAADGARLIRRALKRVFGTSVKFSVTTSKYAGGSSIDIHWPDGPTTKQVDAVVQGYAGATFNGMIDLKEYKGANLIDGILVSWGADFVSTHRDLTDDAKSAAREELGAEIAGFEARQRWVQDQEVYRLLQARDLREETA